MNIKKWIYSCVIGSIIAIFYSLWLTAHNPVGNLYEILIYIYLVLFFTIIVRILLFNLSQPRLANYSSRWKIAWFIGSIFFGILLSINLPISVPQRLQPVSLTITSTGQKNPQSQGSEVWIVGLYYFDGSLVNPGQYSISDGWEIKNGAPFSPSLDHPANLTWHGQANRDMKLIITAHPWSGMVLITWNGNQQTVDLYDPNGKNINIDLPVNTTSPIWVNILFYFSVAMGIGVLFFVFSTWIITKTTSSSKSRIVINKWRWLVYAIPMTIGWLIYLISFWPSIITLDSAALWRQVLNAQFNDWQPAFLPMLMWVVTRIWLSPAIIAIFQILTLSIISGYLFYKLEWFGAPKFAIWIAIILMTLSPVNGSMVITLWKDIPYSIVLIAMTVFSLDLYLSKGQSIRKISSILIISVLLLLLALFRHNGLAVSLVFVVLAIILLRNNLLQWAVVTAILLISFLGMRNIVYPLASVDRSPYKLMKIANPVFLIGALIKAQTVFSQDEKQLINNVMPLDSWTYNCYLVDSLIYNPNLHIDYASEHYTDLVKLVFLATLRNPEAIIDHMICSSAIIWKITPPSNSLPYIFQSIFKNNNGYSYIDRNNSYNVPVYETFFSPNLTKNLFNFYYWTITGTRVLLFWRPALYLFLLIILSMIFSLQQKNTNSVIVFLPAFAQTLIMSIISAAQYPRYQFSIYLIAMAIWPIIFSTDAKEHI